MKVSQRWNYFFRDICCSSVFLIRKILFIRRASDSNHYFAL